MESSFDIPRLGPLSIGARCALLSVLFSAPVLCQEARFVDRTEAWGLDFAYRHFGTGEKYMPENMGPGVAVLDVDGDGRLDLFFPQGRPLVGDPEPGVSDRLYRQLEDGRFEDWSARAGLAAETGYGQGVAFGDVDRDGDLDLYVTNFGANALWRNRGDGTFAEVTAEAGVGQPDWGVGTGFFDADGDGDLDLFVVNYVDFAFDNHKFCGDARKGLRSYCHPDVYDGQGDALYRNDGDGRFTEVTLEAGILRTTNDKGLGVAFFDADRDGRQDVYVSNDSTMNYLYLNRTEAKDRLVFEEGALFAGVGFNGSGAAEASMGIEIGDVDGDGRLDLFLTHLDQETNTHYRAEGDALFTDATEKAGLAAPSLPWVGFGTALFDHDHDGDLDLFVVNGHIIDNIEAFDSSRRHRQPPQLFDNQGDGRFVEISETLDLPKELVGRGAIAADLDRDGDLDLVIAQNEGPALVAENLIGQDRPSLMVELESRGSAPDGFGARLELVVGDRTLVREIRSSSSYLSQGPPVAHFGLGEATVADELAVHWPSGRVDRHEKLEAGFLYTFGEGSAERRVRAFERPSER